MLKTEAKGVIVNSKLNILLEALEGKNTTILLLENRLKIALSRPEELINIVSELTNELYLTKDIEDNRTPFYWFYLAIALYAKNDHEESKNALANAIMGFRTQGLNLNESIGELLFGTIHYKNKKTERAQRACKTASTILGKLIQQCKLQRFYRKADLYKKYLRKIHALERLIKKNHHLESKDKSPHTHKQHQPNYLLLQWLPIYDSVRAGKQGIVWGGPSTHNGTTIYNVELEGKLHEIFSVYSTSKSREHQITLSGKNNYCWAKVKGHSMNACEPVQINNNDYVLCSTIWSKDQDAIVIAGFINENQETSMMVKKYVSRENLLISETADISEDYSPIQITAKYKILGTVLAVAKPAKK